MDWRIGVTDLLSPDKCTLLLIDHQGMQLTGVTEHRRHAVRRENTLADQSIPLHDGLLGVLNNE